MKTLTLMAGGAFAVLALTATAATAADVQNFDGAVTTSPTEAPGVWYTDRYNPATFQSGVAYGGHSGTLYEATSPADGASNRPSAYSASFYNTQGRAYDLPANTTSASIQLFNDPLYANAADGRIAGFWGVGVDSSNNIDDYPIIELDKIGGNLQLLGWDSTGNGGWTNLSQGMGAAGSWATLGITLTPTAINYSVNGVFAGSVNSGGSTSLKSTILQVYNTTDGVTDGAHWDNLSVGVPEPATWAMMIMGFGGLGAMLRQRRQKTALSAAA